ncbi:MAG: hypothetical protein LUF85_08625 [Bacteroides sp.]|nr:hypothetical protein [Bacteroides sp.]
MTYIQLINHFWSIRRIKQMTAYEADLYFYLLKECNVRKWINPFELPSRNIELELGISRKTICSLRIKLRQKGLINFKEGNKRSSGAFYEILYVSDRNKESDESGNIKGYTQSNIHDNIYGNPIIKTKNKTKNKDKDAAKAATLERKKKFYSSLIPFLETYSAEMLRDFFDYWSEMNKSETKMRFELGNTWELSKRLSIWAKKTKKYMENQNKLVQQVQMSEKRH